MKKPFTLEYWVEDDWYIGRLKEVPGMFSQGESLRELEDNIEDAYRLVLEDQAVPRFEVRTKEIGIEV